MIEYIALFVIVGLLPAAIAKTRGQDFFVWWVYGAFLFPIALIHALVVKPGSTSVEGFVKGRAESSASGDLKARLDAWHADKDRRRGRAR